MRYKESAPTYSAPSLNALSEIKLLAVAGINIVGDIFVPFDVIVGVWYIIAVAESAIF
jgi:uncharacterized membrane protein